MDCSPQQIRIGSGICDDYGKKNDHYLSTAVFVLSRNYVLFVTLCFNLNSLLPFIMLFVLIISGHRDRDILLAPLKVEEDVEEEVVEVVEEDKLVENVVTDDVVESISESVAVVEAKVEIDETTPSVPQSNVVTDGVTEETKPSGDLEGDKI